MNNFADIFSYLMGSDLSAEEQANIYCRYKKALAEPIQVLLTGSTGAGKSSVINALLGRNAATVGGGPEPETLSVAPYAMTGFVFWDTPGLGDTIEKDTLYKEKIREKLNEKTAGEELCIDFVLVLVDGESRDMGTTFKLVRQVILPDLRTQKKKRLLIVINKADKMLSGHHWDSVKKRPDAVLAARMAQKEESLRRRMREETNLDLETICLSAGYTDPETRQQEQAYNILRMLVKILTMVPQQKRKPRLEGSQKTAKPLKTNTKKTENECAEDVDVLETALAVATAPVWIPLGIVGTVAEKIEEGCYITTATCEAFGKPDDCYELTQFRTYRDTWLRRQPDGEELIREYYATAPQIVAAINCSPDRMEIYRELNENYLVPCLHYIEAGENQACKDLYIRMVHEMQKKMTEKEF